jgi:hypothetical protein
VRIEERGGGVTTIGWDEIEEIPPVSGRRPILVETDDTTHVLPWSFHPSLARDLHLLWRTRRCGAGCESAAFDEGGEADADGPEV